MSDAPPIPLTTQASARPLAQRLLRESISVKQAILADVRLLDDIDAAIQAVIAAYRAGHKVLLAGNGGSAADAQHMAAELVCRFSKNRPALPAIALATNASIMTATSNDLGYEQVFSRQVEAHGRPGDVFIAISTSGKSPNIVAALACAERQGLKRIGLTGQAGGEMSAYCDPLIRVPSDDTARIQESHLMIGHIVCAAVEQALFRDSRKAAE